MANEQSPGRHRPDAQHPQALPPPYGIFDLSPVLQLEPGPFGRIRCCHLECERMLIPPSRGRAGEVCPDHGIRTHKSATFSYRDPTRNSIVAPDLVSRILRNPFKFSCMFHLENSEDMLVLNTFRSLQQANALHLVARLMTGLDVEEQPRLFLWGLELTDDTLQPWDLLIAARRRFESNLPVDRPATEPDIVLFHPGRYLLLCEAKFTSPNPIYTDGPRKDPQSLTKAELLSIYDDPVCRMIDAEKARQADSVAYQMFRNVQFAQWMARQDSTTTRPFFCNLTRQLAENATFEQFFRLVRPEFGSCVVHVFWEQVFVLTALTGGRLHRLRRYLLTKTANLRPAFQLGYF